MTREHYEHKKRLERGNRMILGLIAAVTIIVVATIWWVFRR